MANKHSHLGPVCTNWKNHAHLTWVVIDAALPLSIIDLRRVERLCRLCPFCCLPIALWKPMIQLSYRIEPSETGASPSPRLQNSLAEAQSNQTFLKMFDSLMNALFKIRVLQTWTDSVKKNSTILALQATIVVPRDCQPLFIPIRCQASNAGY